MSQALLAERSAGVLLHLTSLPSPYGRGDMGHAAYRFVEFLAAAGAGVWQVLPLGPTHEDGSPYNTISAYAGNPRLISLDWLADRGLLGAGDLVQVRGGLRDRQWALDVAAQAFASACTDDDALRERFGDWCAAQHWLEDYVLFAAVSEERASSVWTGWEPGLRERDPAALAAAAMRLDARLAALRFEQYVFAEQWQQLHDYALSRGLRVFGDMPIFVAHDSADVWSARHLFRLDAEGRPITVTGVPPDYFSAEGQRWGNPHYDWDAMAADGYAWWQRRIAGERQRVDLLRIDHFRGFHACWHIARDAVSAAGGHWENAPGDALLGVMLAASGEGTLVAENLGIITPEVEALRRRFALPGMLVLQFAFDGNATNPYLPHNHEVMSVVYTGTHDNDTTLGWFQGLDAECRARVLEYLGTPGEPMPWPLVRAALASVARLAVIPMQDLLALDSRHRMNTPGTVEGNWGWQCALADFTTTLAARLRDLLHIYGRHPQGTGG